MDGSIDGSKAAETKPDAPIAAPRPSADHSPASCWHLFFLIVLICFIFFVFVQSQLAYVVDWTIFLVIFCILIALSFLSSAIEAAIPYAERDQKVTEVLSREADALIREYEILERVEANAHDPRMLKKNAKTRRKLDRRRLRDFWRRSALRGNPCKEVYMGSLAAFSVFANAALVAFLPLALRDSADSSWLGNVKFPDVYELGRMYFSEREIRLGSIPMVAVDLTSQKIFLFCIVSIPILLVGKILPKIFGQRNPIIGYRMFGFASFCRRYLFWTVQGVRYVTNLSKGARTSGAAPAYFCIKIADLDLCLRKGHSTLRHKRDVGVARLDYSPLVSLSLPRSDKEGATETLRHDIATGYSASSSRIEATHGPRLAQ